MFGSKESIQRLMTVNPDDEFHQWLREEVKRQAPPREELAEHVGDKRAREILDEVER